MNFFVLMLILFVILSVFNRDRISQKRILIFETCTCLPLILFTAFRNNYRFMGDTYVYVNKFLFTPVNFTSFLETVLITDEFGYKWLVYLTKIVSDNVNFSFFVTALLVIFLISFTFKKFSCNYLFSMFLFVTSCSFYSWLCNGTRQGIAIAIIFSSLPFILNKKYIISGLFILLAWTFHHTSLLFIPFLFICTGDAFNKKTLFSIFTVLFIIIFLNEFTSMLVVFFGEDSKYGSEITYYLEEGRGMNFFGFLFGIIPLFIALLNVNKIKVINDPLVNLLVNFSVVSSMFLLLAVFAGGIMFGRIPGYFILFNYLLIPWELKYLFDKKNRLIMTFLIVMVYISYYLFIMMRKGILFEHHFIF